MKPWIVAIVVGFIAGAAATIWLTHFRHPAPTSTLDHDLRHTLFQALVRASSAAIPPERNKCDLDGPNAGGAPATVGTFVGNKLSFGLWDTPFKFEDLKCEGFSPLKCTWSYGLSREPEGGSWSLGFQYDSKNGVVDPASVECLQVP